MTINYNGIDTMILFSFFNSFSLLIIVIFIFLQLMNKMPLPALHLTSTYEILFMTFFLLCSGFFYIKSKEETDKNKDEDKNITKVYFGFLIANIISYAIFVLLFLYYSISFISYLASDKHGEYKSF